MQDKNGTEIKTGTIVEITGAYFKSDNGLYFVDNSPGDPTWSGSEHSLKRISKAGKISTAKYSTCFWPIGIFASNRAKAAEARRWNAEHAEIEVKSVADMAEVADHFRKRFDSLQKETKRCVWDFGEDSEIVQKYRAMLARYETVIAEIENTQKEGA